jgi:phage terminase large subunit-like protein
MRRRAVSSWPPLFLTPVDSGALARSDGKYAAQFAEAFGSIGKDGIAGRAGAALELRAWQKSLLEHLYARDESGGYVARTALVGMPRKNGKSALSSAAIALYSLIAEGVQGAEIIVAAAEKEQARIVFGEARRMVETSELADEVTLYRDSIFVPSSKSVLRVVSAEAYSKEGLNPSRVIIDELHAHRDRSLFDVLSLAMGNRGNIAQLVAITTAGLRTDVTGQDSVAYQLYQYGKKVASGEIVDPSFFMAWWEAPAEADYKSRDTWQVANPGFDDLVAESDFASAVLRTPEHEFRTKRLNQWVNVKNAWLPAGAWEDLADESVRLEPGDEYYLGFDGSWKNDSTSLICVIMPRFDGDVFRVFRAGSWEKDFTVNDDSWVIDKQEVANFVVEFTRNNPGCREMVCDPTYWQDEMWQWADAGVNVVEFPQTLAYQVPATAKLFEGIMSKKIRHNGDAALTRHIENCILKMDSKGGSRLTKDYRNPKLKIDNAVALMFAYSRASAKLEPEVIPQFYF